MWVIRQNWPWGPFFSALLQQFQNLLLDNTFPSVGGLGRAQQCPVVGASAIAIELPAVSAAR